jgi:hypothetical protein
MVLVLLLMFIGFVTFQQREFKVSRYRKIDGPTCRMLGFVMLVGAGLSFILGDWVGFVSLITSIIVALMTSQPIIG